MRALRYQTNQLMKQIYIFDLIYGYVKMHLFEFIFGFNSGVLLSPSPGWHLLPTPIPPLLETP
jgi:hypothetical protein